MMKQLTLAMAVDQCAGFGTQRKPTRREAFLDEMDAIEARDPENHQTRKGKQWHFGMKLHIGVDSQSGLAHRAVVTAANVHDKHPLPQLLHGEEQRVYGDSAYASQKALIHGKAPKAHDFTNKRTRRKGIVDEVARRKNRNKSKIRARVEHVFAVVKRLGGFTKVRLSRSGEERQSRLRCTRAGQSVHVARSRDGTGAPVKGQRRANSLRRAPLRRNVRRNARFYGCHSRSRKFTHALVATCRVYAA
ncbi:Transposase DDE domain-containing protein [Paraburkholderia hospita]|nr:Transposase DDE domain-containing protein [Paraburkholderia hospita]